MIPETSRPLVCIFPTCPTVHEGSRDGGQQRISWATHRSSSSGNPQNYPQVSAVSHHGTTDGSRGKLRGFHCEETPRHDKEEEAEEEEQGEEEEEGQESLLRTGGELTSRKFVFLKLLILSLVCGDGGRGRSPRAGRPAVR